MPPELAQFLDQVLDDFHRDILLTDLSSEARNNISRDVNWNMLALNHSIYNYNPNIDSKSLQKVLELYRDSVEAAEEEVNFAYRVSWTPVFLKELIGRLKRKGIIKELRWYL